MPIIIYDGITHKIKTKRIEHTREAVVYIFANEEKTPWTGTWFSKTTPTKEMIEWAKNSILNYSTKDKI